MIRLVTAMAATFLFVVPVTTTTTPLVSVAALLAMLLSALGIATLWRWPVVAAACVFVADYTLALLVERTPLSTVTATAVGLVTLLLLQSAELSRCTRHATMAGLARSQTLGWSALAAGTVGAAFLAMLLARTMAGAIPFGAAPILAALGALGAVLALATALVNGARRV